jgi:hypothetical protein
MVSVPSKARLSRHARQGCFQLADDFKYIESQIAELDAKIAKCEAREREIKHAAGVDDAIASGSLDEVQRAEKRAGELLELAKEATEEACGERHHLQVALNKTEWQLKQVDQWIQRMEKSKDAGTSIALMALRDEDHSPLYKEQMELLDELTANYICKNISRSTEKS